MRKTWKRLISAVVTVSLISSFNVSKITFAENIATDGIVIDENNFPDNIFQNYVKDNFDTNKDSKLSEEELSSVKTIGVKWLKIKTLKGIEYFKNLEHINAEMNYIEELDLSQNKNLISVYCNNNMLTSIKLPNENENYTLEYLDIFSNMLTEVDLHNLKGLTFLHIDDNRITNLDLSDNPLTAGHGFVAQNNYMQKIILPNNGKEYEWVEYLGTQLFPKDKSIGYKVEWYLDEEKTQILDPKVTKKITLNGQTLYAEYVPIEYTVKFNPGMGLGESITQEFKYGISQNLLKNQFTKEGYEFAGWKDTNGKIYSDEEEIINLTDVDGKIINLTATWKKAMLNSEIKITTESLNKVYDGVAVQEPKVQKTGSTNKTVFTWYQFINDEWKKLSSAPVNIGRYKVVASVAADEDYKAASAEKEFEITKAIPQYENIENLKATYGDTLEDVKLPEGFSWQEDLSTSVGNAGENKFKVRYIPKDTENYEVVENIEVTIIVEKVANSWIIEPSIEGWKIGEEAKKPVGQSKYGEVEFTYSNLENGTFIKEVPTEAGTWYMKASVIGNENYSDLSIIKKFVISKNTNEWIEELNIKNWTYGEANIDPVVKSKYGNVEFTYSNSQDGIFTNTVPTNAGIWYVKATVKATEIYTGLESIKEFEISKAIPQYDKIENLKATYGDTLKDVKLPEGFSWQEDLSTSVGNAGENKFKVKYTPKDTENYEVVENIEVTINVEKVANTWIVEPSIEGWKIGEKPNNPIGQAEFGVVEFTYSNSENGTFTKEIPTEAGTWYMKSTVIGNENYTTLEKVVSFVIEEVKPNQPIIPSEPVKPELDIRGGARRYETAVELSKSKFDSADTVVIAGGYALADGLTATPIATEYKSPLLLVEKNNIPEATKNEIKRLRAKNVIIVGGTTVVAKEVENQLLNLGISKITRLGGSDRYETSILVAQYIDSNLYKIENIVVTNGLGEADAMSISPVSGRDRMPIILVRSNYIPSSVENWLKVKSLNNAYIIGGQTAINDNVLNQINTLTTNDISGNRLGGSTRYETNALIIEKFYGDSTNKVYLSKGIELIDALSSGPIAALENSPVVLAGNDLTETQRSILSKRSTKTVVQAGYGISENVIELLRDLLSTK